MKLLTPIAYETHFLHSRTALALFVLNYKARADAGSGTYPQGYHLPEQYQYDSVYIDRSFDTDRTSDTITVTKTMTEYRYRLLRDTVRIVQRDSIPYEVRITEVKEVRKPPNIFDYLCYLSFGILTSMIAIKLTGSKLTKLIKF